MDPAVVAGFLSGLGKGVVPGLIAYAKAMGVQLPPGTADDGSNLTPAELIQVVRDIGFHFFPGLEATRTPA